MSRLKCAALAVLAAAAASCGDGTTTTPTPTVPPTLTDTYSGTLNRNGAASYSFTMSQSGDVQATLTSLAPNATLLVGLSLGTWNGVSCQVVLANDKATTFSRVVGAASGAGSLCVRIYDVGNVTEPVTYEIQVVHY